MLEKKDNYVGEREPLNKLRHGKGIYTYKNQFFQYEGEWENGKKHGLGILRFNDNSGLNYPETQEKLPYCTKQSYYEGEFQNGEITGKGVYVYSNGNVYKGEFLEGEKHGQGVFNTEYEQYTGEFQYNQYHGNGIIKKSNGDVIEGYFKNHKPHGNCEMNLISKQEKYIGQMQNGLKHGEGEYNIPNYSYKGNFENDKKSGYGVIQYTNGFIYEGEWKDDEPTLITNRQIYEQIKEPLSQEDLEKAEKEKEQEKQQKKQQKQTQDDKNQNQNENAILEYQIQGKPFSFELSSTYQPPQIEDPNQPTQEEIDEMVAKWQKDNKKVKNPPPMPDFSAPKMIDPEQIPVNNESGRKLKIQLFFEIEPAKGKENEPRETKEFKVDYRELINQRRSEIQSQLRAKEEEEQEKKRQQQEEEEKEQQNAKTAKKPAKKETKKAGKQTQQQEEEIDQRINLYNPEEPEQNKPLYVYNEQGKVLIENLEFPEDFPPSVGGNYYFLVSDVTEKYKFGTFDPIKIPIQISGPAGSDPKKKKK